MSDHIVARFHAEFDKHYGQNDDRLRAFARIVATLADLRRPVEIVETGCARQVGNWAGDGQSTVVWDWIVRQLGGSASSFDIADASVTVARTLAPNATIVQEDSVIALRRYKNPEGIDLLYLDSYDWTGTLDSPMHHLAELASVYSRLRSGCLIAVDDCFVDDGRVVGGKGSLVARLLRSLDVHPIVLGLVTVWQKPNG